MLRFRASIFEYRDALRRSELPATTRAILTYLSTRANTDGGSCFPSVATIAADTAFSKRTVCTHLEKAEEAGWIIRRQVGDGKGWRRNTYTLTVPEPLALCPVGGAGGSPRRGDVGEPASDGGEGGSLYLPVVPPKYTTTFASDDTGSSSTKVGEAIRGDDRPHQRFPRPAAVEEDGYPVPFERTWREYPHPDRDQPGGKPVAYRYWWLALKHAPEATPELLHDAVLAYRDGHTGDYRQNFATFFNGRDDDYNWRTWLGHTEDGETASFASRYRSA